MQSGCTTFWAQGERGSTMPTAARIVAAGDAGREPVPETVDAPRCRMTRHGVSTARCRIIVEPGASSRSFRRCGSLVEPLTRAECGRVPLRPCPPGLIKELVSSLAMGYKLPLSGGVLFRAAGSVGVQNVLFAGVFVPPVWNRQAYQSASRPFPVGARLRLYYGVRGSFHRFDSRCKLMYTSRTSPQAAKSPCNGRRGLQGSPLGTLHPSLPLARLDEIQNKTVLFDKKVAYR